MLPVSDLLRTLIGVDDFGLAMSSNGVLKHILAPLGSQRVADAPANYLAAVYMDARGVPRSS
jgi:hypothetical protein